MANGLPPLEKLKKKELPPLNSLKKKGDGTPQPETTSQPTGVITQPLAQGAQQGTQPQFTSWRDVAPPEVQEIQDVTATRKPISLQDKKVEGALKERAFNVISEEINNIEKADKAPDTFEYGKQFLKQRDGVDTQYQPKTKEQSLQEINRQVKDVYPNLQTTTINESGQTVYTDELQNGINALFVSKQNREAESNDKFLATVSRYKEMPSIFKPAMGVVLSVDALAYDIASLATQFVGADELTLYLRNKVEDWNQEKSALQASSGVTLEQQQKGAFATIKEDPIAGLKLLGYQTLDAIPSMAAIILAPEVSVGRTGAIQLSRGAAQQFVTPIASNVYKQALKDAYKTLGTRSNTGITALSGLESRSAYEDAISSGLSREEAIGIAMLKGISVYATEHVFMGAEDMVRNSLVNYGQDAAKNTVKKGMKDYLKEVGEQFSKEGLLEEGTVNLIGQIIDNAAQGKEFDIYSYLDESAVGGLMGAGSVSLKTVLDNTSSLVSTIMTNSELKQKGKVISELRKELENNIDLSQQDKESLKSALITAQKEYDDIRKEQDDLINKFSDEDKQSYIDINRNILSTIDKSRRTDNDVVKNVLNEKLKTLAQEKQAIEEKYASQEMSSKTGEILDTEKPQPTKVTVLGKEVNQYNNYIPEKTEDVEEDAIYTFTSDNKEGIPEVLREKANVNKADIEVKNKAGETVRTEKKESWSASINGKELIDLFEQQKTQQEQKTDETAKQEEPMLEGVQATRDETKVGQESAELRTEEATQKEVVEPLKDVESTSKALEGKTDKIKPKVYSPKNKRIVSFNIDNEGVLNRIKSTPVFNTIFSKSQIDKLKIGNNTVELNMTAWGKAERMLNATDETNSPKTISEAYHKAKKDGSNPELVKAVEDLLTPKTTKSDTQDKAGIPSKEQKGQEPKQAKPKQEASGEKAETGRDVQTPKEKGRVTPDKTKEEVRVEPDEKEVEDVAKKTGITPKNLRDLYKINRDMFGLNKVKAFANAVVMDRMIGAMAKRAGLTKQEMYGKLEFRRASEKELPQGVKFQVDAWHGSPYQFDKFTTQAIGTGEGAQAFGWGLYFTDLESIAKSYATSLAKQQLSSEDIKKWHEILNEILPEDFDGDDTSRLYAVDVLTAKLYKQDFVEPYWLKGKKLTEEQKAEVDLIVKKYESKLPIVTKPIVYKVSLHKGKTPDQYTWLEWDKPLSKIQKEAVLNNLPNSPAKANKIANLKNRIDKNGSDVYKMLSDIFNSDINASLFLLESGIDGIKYPAESISRGATSDTARGFNYVVFDENAVSIEEVIKFQKDAVKARGAMMMAMDGRAIIYALEDPNVSTPLHELAHVFEHYLTEAERTSVLKWANSKEWTTEVSEKFARGFEKYLADGKAPTVSLQKIFNRFKEWLTDIYNGIVGSDIDIQLNDEMRDLYGKMLGVDAVKEQEKKSFANIIRGLKIDTTGKAFDATLGLPVAIYNNAIEITAKAVEAGVEVKKAIQKGIDYANKKMNGKKWDVEGFRNQLLTTIKGQFEQQAAQMRSSKKEVKTPKTRFLGFLTRSGAKIVNANDYIDSMKTNMNLDVSDTKKRIDDAKSKARKVFAKTNKIKNDKEVANIVNDLLNRIISPDEYNMTAQEAIDKIRKDIKNPKVAQELIDAGLDIRTQIDNMTKFMLENAEKFNLSDEAIENLKSNIGNYIHREYMFFSERGKTFRKQSLKTRRLEKWNPTDEMINEAIAEHAIYNGISVDEAKKQIEDLIEDWKKKRTPIKVTGNNVIRIQDVKVEADLMKGRVRIPQNFTLFSEASKEAEKELQKKGIDSKNKNYNTLLSVETERIYKDKGGEYVELPPHLRKLLGEERNATQRYINTMLAMSNMVYKAQAMDMIVKSFDGKDGWIYDKEPANNKGDYKLVNDKYSPLNGKWVNIYLIEEFNKLPIYETDLAIAKAYFEYQSLVRTTKTVANSPTNFKNVIGGIFAQMQNGFFIALTNPKLAALSIYSRGHLYLKGRRNELAKQVLKDGAEAGVLSSSVDVEVLGLKGSILSERVKFGKSELGRRYAQQDDWTKSLMVYLYKQDVSLMLFGKKFDDLSKEQQKEVLTKTGELVKLGVPTFSKLPSWFRTISRLPTGDFISFTVEATRSLIGSGIIAYEHARAASTGVDSKGNTINETQRRAYAKDAAKRIAGLVAIQSVGKAIGAGAFSLGGSAIEYGSQVFAAIFGGGDDEDENDETKLAKTQVVKEINKTIPDWAVGDRVIVTNVDDDGNVTFYNWTGLEPSSETAQLIGGNFKYFEQFYKGSITAKMLIQLYNNENEIGNEIYLEDEPLYKQVFNSAYFLGKNTLLPPFINSTEYEIKRRKEDDENFGVISQDNTVEENAQSAKELTQVFLSRATIRSYNYNIYNRVKQIAYAQSRHGRVDNLDNIKDEEQIDLRLKNISVIRDAYQICLKHRITTSDSPAKIKKISELNDAVKRNYTDFEEAMIYETDDAKFKEMYDFVMSKSKDIVEYNKLKDERKK